MWYQVYGSFFPRDFTKHYRDTKLVLQLLIFSPKISSTAQRMELNITPRLFTKYKAIIDAIKNIMDSWGVGHAECNNGIVLFVSRGDRVMHIATGFFP